MGKTRLLDEAAIVARRRRFRVGTCAADPGDSMVELATLMGALFDGPDPVLDRGELPDLHGLPEQRYWLLQDVRALLERAALKTALVICLDDLQWTDGGTVAALRALPRRLATVPVAWILAFRPGPGPSQLYSALGYLEHSGAEKMVLGPLDSAAVRQVTAGVLQAKPDGDLLQMADRAGGNPFFLVEMLWGLREEQLIRIESGRAELVEARLPRRVGESMRRRLDQMPGAGASGRGRGHGAGPEVLARRPGGDAGSPAIGVARRPCRRCCTRACSPRAARCSPSVTT